MRHVDWEMRLADFLRACRHMPFAYGSHDCCIFAAGAVLAMTGEDRMAEFRGRYRSAAGSVRALRLYGAGTLPATLDTKFPPIPASHAQRGDLVLMDDGQPATLVGGIEVRGAGLGVVLGGFALGVGAEGQPPGLVRVARPLWHQAWRVI